jgi:transposase
MRFIGIDIGSRTHAVAVLDERGETLVRATGFAEDAEGYAKLLALIGPPHDALAAMEATGHYWRNLFARLAAEGFAVALLNPYATRRFADSDLERTKTDAVDAAAIARFAQQKRPRPTALPDQATQELRELVRLRDRFVQDLGDRTRQLHRLVDLGFPEAKKVLPDLASDLAIALFAACPTAAAFRAASVRFLAKLVYDGRHKVPRDTAQALVDAARRSVAAHDGPVYRMEVQTTCEDMRTLKDRVRRLEKDVETTLETHEVGKLLATIDGIGPQTAAFLVAVYGDPAQYASGAAMAAQAGVVPALRQSGKRASQRAACSHIGDPRIRRRLWMPVMSAVRDNLWLRAYYERLRARGKQPKVALVACMRKLFDAIHSVARHRRPFVPHVVTPQPAEASA